ncbi:histidine phosphatase family protein [Streptomyces hainanensis]|uniref:Histidine phosphatase family protein n=1 Tax=Streptomyces hainanensis TaxID=402648 RepID=A0A4R4T8L8_9ACTN|nr:histidine phosphatase family protein [Streptomyces hainanensis]TDC73521.1 histidine phosphatase family protein [Streptomyces hainanensis]
MRTIHVVTHPEATHHVERVVGGWHDSRLTPEGLRAAGAIARELRARIPGGAEAQVFTSDLRRTRETADAVGQALGRKPVPHPGLREKSFGEAEGRPQAWLDQRFVPPPAVGDRMTYDEGVPGAEPNAAVARRVYAAMDEILRHPAEHQVVVTHGFALTFVVASWIGMPLDALDHVIFQARSGSITTLHEDDFHRSRRLTALGDVRHLDPAAD